MTDLQLLFANLLRLEADLSSSVEARLRHDCNMPLNWFEPMKVMRSVEGCRVYDIADELGITVGGTSKIVDRIEAAGYCLRHPNPDDRRSSIIRLTASGRRLITKADLCVDEVLETRLRDALSPRMLQQVATAVTRLRSVGRDATAEHEVG